ncbi:hypothetical protein V6N11_010414 [Hibiscus sabdariffa]|uniref:Uncharacterized protein n=1 Tax=Hibiscus sabdariffa TaxID=183260 RepID=A0ABR2S5P5_9ROSI
MISDESEKTRVKIAGEEILNKVRKFVEEDELEHYLERDEEQIWSEPDEIHFLQALLRSPPLFPERPPTFLLLLPLMSHPYTKSQLSEKLRRLRKNFITFSSRLARGLNPSSLSPMIKLCLIFLEGFGVLTLLPVLLSITTLPGSRMIMKAMSLMEVQMIFVKQGVVCIDTMEKKWNEQRVSEFDAFGRDLRLVIENYLIRRCVFLLKMVEYCSSVGMMKSVYSNPL